MYTFNISSENSLQQSPLGVPQALSLISHSQAEAHKGQGNPRCHMGPSANKNKLQEQRATCCIDKYRTFLGTIVILSNSFLLMHVTLT